MVKQTTVVSMRHLPLSISSLPYWLFPEPYVYIGRGSKWGNPFRIGKDGNRAEVIEQYRSMITTIDADFHELTGKTLVCWCKPLACHGDVLAELADS